MALYDALQDLKPHVKQAMTSTEIAASWTSKIGFGSLAGSILLAVSVPGMGIPLSLAPLAAGLLSLKFWNDSRDEKPRREAEYRLLKSITPQLPEFLWGLHLKSCTVNEIVGAYDGLVSAVEGAIDAGNAITEKDVSDYLWHRIESMRKMASTIEPPKPAATAAPPLPATRLEPPAMADYKKAFDSLEDTGTVPTSEPSSPPPTIMPPAQEAKAELKPAKPSIVHYDPSIDLARNIQSAFIAGVPGAGKGMVVSNAGYEVKKLRPELTIMAVDPKADPKEQGYWKFADIYRGKPFKMDTPEGNAEWILDQIQFFNRLPSPKLLILDEGLTIVNMLKLANLFESVDVEGTDKPRQVKIDAMGRFTAFLSHISSMGDSQQEWMWFVSQIVNAGDLKISGGMRSIFRAIAIVSPKNRNAVNSFFDTKFVPLPEGGKAEVYALMEQSPVNRAFYDGALDKWLPMPKLHNHSGYDRDSRNSISPAEESDEPSTEGDPRRLKEIADPLIKQLKTLGTAEALATLRQAKALHDAGDRHAAIAVMQEALN